MNILQHKVTAWSAHARHYTLTSAFDAARISETHLGRDKLVTASTEARKSSRVGTDSAAISTVQVRECSHRFAHAGSLNPFLFVCTDEAGVFCSNTRLAERDSVVRALCRFPQRYQCQFDARRVFSHERWETLMYLGTRLQFPAQLVAGLVYSWRQPSGSKRWEHRRSLQRVPHTRVVQAGVKSLTSWTISRCQHSFDL